MMASTVARRRDFVTLMNDSLPKFQSIIPETAKQFLTPQRIIALSVNAFSRSAALQECEPISILNAIVTAVQLGFEPNGPLGHAYLVPYKNVCTCQIGYRGLADLARRTAGYALIDSRAVYAHDPVFELEYDPAPRFRHVPILDGERGDITHVYSYAYLRGSTMPIFEHMSLADVEAIRRSSRSKDSPAWRDWYGEMGKKSCMKRMLKDQPLSIELADAIAFDDGQNGLDLASRPKLTGGTEGLMRRLESPGEPVDEEEHDLLDKLADEETVPG
jgi:recombination protein RecT